MANIKFEWNDDGLRQLQDNIQKAFQNLTVPTEGSEDDAVADVRRQLIEQGVEPNDEGIRKMVREHRQG